MKAPSVESGTPKRVSLRMGRQHHHLHDTGHVECPSRARQVGRASEQQAE